MATEFEFIDNIKSKFGLGRVGDDCAVLPKDADTDLLVTADLLIEDIDFRFAWTTPELLGHKVLAVSLSDIAAMGGSPKWAMLSIGVAENLWKTDFLDRFYLGWTSLANKYGVELVGGDISRSPDKLIFDSIVGGECKTGASFSRSGAMPGDKIFVSGTLGSAAGGLRLLEAGLRTEFDSESAVGRLALKQLRPDPELELANMLQTMGIVTSAIDISDGFSSDLKHICDESGVGGLIDPKSLPIDQDLLSIFNQDDCLDLALNGGEDLGLIFTVPENASPQLASLDVTCVGVITANEGVVEYISPKGPAILGAGGFRHF